MSSVSPDVAEATLNLSRFEEKSDDITAIVNSLKEQGEGLGSFFTGIGATIAPILPAITAIGAGLAVGGELGGGARGAAWEKKVAATLSGT